MLNGPPTFAKLWLWEGSDLCKQRPPVLTKKGSILLTRGSRESVDYLVKELSATLIPSRMRD
jgi:hypothetical protein